MIRDAAVAVIQMIAELKKYWTKLYFSKIYANASKLNRVGRENGLERICAVRLKC